MNYDTELAADPFAPEIEHREASEQEVVKPSANVAWAQRALNQLGGARLRVDGRFGPKTQEAVRSFQRRAGLQADGVLGPKTEQALLAAGATPRPGPAPAPTAPAVVRAAGPPGPPAEGPYAGITGAPCQSGRGKCWRGARSRDIIDVDAPWNRQSNRSPRAYDAVLDYFNVGDSPHQVENPRYLAGQGATWCNIYLHDVTRAMWASIPHWVRDPAQRQPPVGWRELNANRTVTWLSANGRGAGWVPIDAALCQWVHRQAIDRTSIPFGDSGYPPGVISAGGRIAAGIHADVGLLAQNSYVAQQFANLGLPVAIAWRNPQGHGHVALVRPEREGVKGELHRSGRFLPRSAQAGARNFTNQPARWIVGRRGLLFYVHA